MGTSKGLNPGEGIMCESYFAKTVAEARKPGRFTTVDLAGLNWANDEIGRLRAEVERLTIELRKSQAGDHDYMQCVATIRTLRKEAQIYIDHIDLMTDEFKRIKALGVDSEVKGLCERAITNTKQWVPVIEQRDKAEAERDRYKANADHWKKCSETNSQEAIDFANKIKSALRLDQSTPWSEVVAAAEAVRG